jgi:hypothetical protein
MQSCGAVTLRSFPLSARGGKSPAIAYIMPDRTVFGSPQTKIFACKTAGNFYPIVWRA